MKRFHNSSVLLLLCAFLSCASDTTIEDEEQPETPKITKIGEKTFVIGDSYLNSQINVDQNNNYISSGVTGFFNSHWNGYLLRTNDTLKELSVQLPDELRFSGNEIGGDLRTSLVENDHLLTYGVLNNFQCVLYKTSAAGTLLYFKVLDKAYANLHIINLVRLDNHYYFLAKRYAGGGGHPSHITEFGKMTLDGDIMFTTVKSEFSAGYELEKFDENSVLLTTVKYFYASGTQTFVGDYDYVHPVVLRVDLEGNTLWASQLPRIETDLFHPSVFHLKKGQQAIYAVYQRRSIAFEAQITKLNFNGDALWTKPIDHITNFSPYKKFNVIMDMDIDADDNLYLIGNATKDLIFGPWYFGLAKFDSNGTHLASTSNADANNMLLGYSLKIDHQQNVVTLSHDMRYQKLILQKFNLELHSL